MTWKSSCGTTMGFAVTDVAIVYGLLPAGVADDDHIQYTVKGVVK